MLAVLPHTSNLLSPCRCFVRFRRGDPEIVSIKNILSVTLMFLDVSIHSADQFVINGQEIIIDYEGIDYGYAAQATPTILKKAITLSQNVYPCRIHGFYILNLPPFLQAACNILLTFLPEKLRKRVRVLMVIHN